MVEKIEGEITRFYLLEYAVTESPEPERINATETVQRRRATPSSPKELNAATRAPGNRELSTCRVMTIDSAGAMDRSLCRRAWLQSNAKTMTEAGITCEARSERE